MREVSKLHDNEFHTHIYIYTIQSFCAYIINNKIDEEHKASKKILLNMHMAMNQSTNKFF